MKNNELLELYNEAQKEAEKEAKNKVKGENTLQWAGCLKKILVEKINYDKNNYLHYKILVEGNSFMEPLTLALSIIGVIASVVMSQLDVIINHLGETICLYFTIFIIFSIYMMFLVVLILRYIENVLKYKKVGIVLDEIYKEIFEGKESKQ